MSGSRVPGIVGLLAVLPACLGGLDRADALCATTPCDAPPPPVCVEPGVLRESLPGGRCRLATGQCEYPFVETPCPLGCFDTQRCRREGDERARIRFVNRWALLPTDGAVLVDLVSAPGCDAGAYEARAVSPAGLEGSTLWQSGCGEGYLWDEGPTWPLVSSAGTVIGFEGSPSYSAYAGGLWLPGPDGGVRIEPRPGRPSLALDEGDGVFWAALDVAISLSPEGAPRWEQPCPGLCGSKTPNPGLAMVVPGRAFVSCRSGCTAFTPDGGLLFTRPSANSGAATSLLLTDSPDHALVGTDTGGLEVMSFADGGGPRFYPVTSPERLWVIAAVVEQRGTVLFAWNATVSQGGRILSEKYYVSRLENPGLVERARVEVACRPATEGLVARRDGSTLVTVVCPPEAPEPGPAIWVYDAQLEVTARLPIAGFSQMVGPLSVDALGNMWVFSNADTLLVLTGTQPPADSPWPMVRADAQNTRRARLPP